MDNVTEVFVIVGLIDGKYIGKSEVFFTDKDIANEAAVIEQKTLETSWVGRGKKCEMLVLNFKEVP